MASKLYKPTWCRRFSHNFINLTTTIKLDTIKSQINNTGKTQIIMTPFMPIQLIQYVRLAYFKKIIKACSYAHSY